MKKYRLLINTAIIAASALIPTQADAAATYSYEFSPNSLLATGKWVKITIPSSGIYEIPYDKLREMGFSDPKKVSVFGQGGRQTNHNFLSSDASPRTRVYEDNPQQVPVSYGEESFYFYGVGPEHFSFNGSLFVHENPNIYYPEGVYLLTDSQELNPIAEKKIANKDGLSEITGLKDYVYFEEDNLQGLFGAGQAFWSYFFKDIPDRVWSLNLPYADSSKKGVMSLSFISDKYSEGHLSWGTTDQFKTVSLTRQSAGLFLGYYSECQISSHGDVKLMVKAENVVSNVAALDNWVFTYTKKFGEDMRADFVEERIAVPSFSEASAAYITVPSGAEVWDITEESKPVKVETVGARAYISNDGKAHTLMTFDPRKRQREIGATWKEIPNQDLHALAAEGAELLIICTDTLRGTANSIAELHRRNDNIKVMVATAQELYNEFTGGLPDPMAYRAMAKMLYQNPTDKLKNVLFLGPLFGDMRNVTKRNDRDPKGADGLIGFQEPIIDLDNAPGNAMDYYGMLADYIPNFTDLATNRMAVGVGILPVYSPEEGNIAYNKIREYMEETDFDWVVNETMAISCPGDNHLHDGQALDFRNEMNAHAAKSASSRFMHDTQILDYIGEDRARKEFQDLLNSGKLMSYYFGHAGGSGFGGSINLAETSNFQSMNNRNLGMMFFAGCELSAPDMGNPGIGELSVTRSPRGLVASIAATRMVYSNYNYTLASSFNKGLFFDATGIRTKTPTVGEVFYYAKNQTSRSNDLKYLLFGDPALRVPVAIRGIQLEKADTEKVAPGSVITVKGKVKQRGNGTDSTPWADDTSFNGFVSLKLTAPADSIRYYNTVQLVQTTDPNGQTVSRNDTIWHYVPASPVRLSSVRAEVRNGEFTARINVPEGLSKYIRPGMTDPRVQLYAGAYDKTLQLGASGYSQLDTYGYGADLPADRERDTQGPDVKCKYDALTQTLRFQVTDDVAVMPGVGPGKSLLVKHDGKDCVVDLSKDYSCAVTAFSVVVPVHDFPEGNNTVSYLCTDQAGNTSAMVNYSFTKAPTAPFSLKALSEAATDRMEFEIGAVPYGAEIRLLIFNPEGKKIYDSPAEAGTMVWECSDLRPGIYRAAVRDNSARGTTVYSNWEEFAVID